MRGNGSGVASGRGEGSGGGVPGPGRHLLSQPADPLDVLTPGCAGGRQQRLQLILDPGRQRVDLGLDGSRPGLGASLILGPPPSLFTCLLLPSQGLISPTLVFSVVRDLPHPQGFHICPFDLKNAPSKLFSWLIPHIL